MEFCDRAQNFSTMAQQNAEILEILLCEVADDREINSVVGEALGVLRQAELFEPLRNLLHCRPLRRFLSSFCQAGPQVTTSDGERGRRVTVLPLDQRDVGVGS